MAATATMTDPPAFEHVLDAVDTHRPTQRHDRQFKKRKLLPHPASIEIPGNPQRFMPRKYDLLVDPPVSRDVALRPAAQIRHKSQTQPATAVLRRSQHSGQHSVRRIGSPPLTPPPQSRASSSNHSVLPSSPIYVETPAQSSENVRPRQPSTPTATKSPPTPDTTPPHLVESRLNAFRPLFNERAASKATTESRTESFRTAPETPYISDEEDARSTLRPDLSSNRTSEATVREGGARDMGRPRPVGLGLGLEGSPARGSTPRSKREFISFDGEYGSENEVEQEWDDNLMRNVTVRRRRPRAAPTAEPQDEVVVEDHKTVTPTHAAKAVRAMSLQQPPPLHAAVRKVSDEAKRSPRLSTQDGSTTASSDVRRSSGMSSKSTVSTVVEAILVGAPPPQRRKTLRHVKKQVMLRDSGKDATTTGATLTSAALDEINRHRRPNGQYGEQRHESLASTGTFNSISSGRARREVWKNGGVPVVVIPDRKSSVRSSREPSLRSTTSRRSKRSQSLGSVPVTQLQQAKDLTPCFDRPARHSRTMSESDGSRSGDQRTMDYPPVIPRRSSSLSAPTSRNVSRAGSLTAESLHAKRALQPPHQPQPEVEKEPAPVAPVRAQYDARPRAQPDGLPELTLQPAPPVEPTKPESGDQARHDGVDGHGDAYLGHRLLAPNTPFSQISIDTNATSAAEVSEAFAVNIYPHQNRSVRMVNHSNRPSESSSGDRNDEACDAEDRRELPVPEGEGAGTVDENGPTTPPQPVFSMDDIDSPLRNPRDPPEPPAVKIIPATPSGLTPAQEEEKQLGHGHGKVDGPRPAGALSLLRRALSRRRHSEYGVVREREPGLLIRTLSLSRNVRNENGDVIPAKRASAALADPPMPPPPGSGPFPDVPPAEANRLHPFWRPAYDDMYSPDEDDWRLRDYPYDEGYGYPPIDNRPRLPRRSLSERMKRTFAILPIQDHDRYEDERYLHRPPNGQPAHRTAGDSAQAVRPGDSPDRLRRTQSHNTGRRPNTAPEDSATAGVLPRRPRLWRLPRSEQAEVGGDDGDAAATTTTGRLPGRLFGDLGNLPRRLSERRREKRNQELRQKISGPREVRDGVGDVIRRNSGRQGP